MLYDAAPNLQIYITIQFCCLQVLISVLIYIFAILVTRTVGFPHRGNDSEIEKYFGNILYSALALKEGIPVLFGWVWMFLDWFLYINVVWCFYCFFGCVLDFYKAQPAFWKAIVWKCLKFGSFMKFRYMCVYIYTLLLYITDIYIYI